TRRSSDAVIDLVRARMIEIFALEPDLRTAKLLGPSSGMVDGARTPHEMLQFVGEFVLKIGIVAVFLVRVLELVQRMNQRFRDERTAVLAKMPLLVGQVIRFQ